MASVTPQAVSHIKNPHMVRIALLMRGVGMKMTRKGMRPMVTAVITARTAGIHWLAVTPVPTRADPVFREARTAMATSGLAWVSTSFMVWPKNICL
ncbi:MAG: hypothetical protein A4E63_02382 [Syntrophorhabdus sp. PtaU1.Bin050]|nr:MAG: hypothetical protein A4E63_02382 [Syntrophorhabdus sp. PtaU1.Bin050]